MTFNYKKIDLKVIYKYNVILCHIIFIKFVVMIMIIFM
jgi:hypothetical protein